jgi:hypothetical protein
VLGTALAAAFAFALFVTARADAAQIRIRTFHPVHVHRGVFTFRLRGIKPRNVRFGRLKAARQRKPLRLADVRRAARKGVLRIRWPHLKRRNRRLAVLVVGIVAAGGVLVPVTKGPAPPPTPPQHLPCPSFGAFRAGNWPGGCWRPYADGSPFNQPLPHSPRVSADSGAIVSRLLGWNQFASAWIGTADTSDDYWHPTYYPKDSDPEYRIHCVVYSCRDIEGQAIRIPASARPAGGSDGHMTVVDQSNHWEYDFWEVKTSPLPADGGTIVVGAGGRTRIGTSNANGLGSNANAAQWGLLAGVIRAQEMEAGQINHALTFVARCDNHSYVYPARGVGRPCSAVGESNADAPPMGTRFQLNMSPGEIDALPVPAWKKTILRAMARYGLYLADTGGGFLSFESGSTYTSFGDQDEMEVFARAHMGEGGITTSAGPDGRTEYTLDLKSGVPWDRLRVIDPCVTKRSC